MLRFRHVRKVIEPISPSLYYAMRYWVGWRQATARYDHENDAVKRAFLEECNKPGKKCLQIAVRDAVGKKFGPNWVSVDKYDDRDFIDYHDDIHQLHFENGTFDAVACDAVLEHVPKPWVAIAEFHRVLKPGGTIWISIPMTYPYHEGPKDYWRVTPDALRIWMADFEEQACGIYYWTRSSLVCSTYFFGAKPLAKQA